MRWLVFCLCLVPIAAFAAIGGVVPVSVAPQFGAVPYTGFNSFYAVGGSVSQTYMQAVSDYLVTSGLQAAWGGEILADIDESWTSITGSTVTRDGSGHPVPSGSFTSMPALVAHIKANGQIPGIYRDGGQVGCATEDWGAGTYLSDLTYFFQTWGFQAIKSDGCGIFSAPNVPILSGRTVYGSADALLKGFGTPFLHLYGYSNFGTGSRGYTQGWAFAPRMGSAAFRYSDDVGGAGTCNISFTNVLNNARVAVQHIGTTGPGHVNDADYLGANNNAVGGTLNTNEAITQMALAALLSSPWVVACDPRNLGTTELAALKNADMISALKDPWVHAGTRLDGGSSPQIWEMYCKHLNASGSRFIVAVNEDPASQTITVDPSLCGITGTYTLKNVLTASTSSTSGTFSTGSLASHASGVYLLTSGTESNVNCWATNPAGSGQIADGYLNGCAFTADNNGNPAGGLPKDGTTATTATAITTTGLTNPAAQGCYQNQRKGVIEDDPNEAAIEYLADNLVAGATYHYRVHLAEIEGNTAGQRLFNMTVNTGLQQVAALASHDIFTSAGGANKAEIIEGNVVADHGYLSFDFEPLSPPTGVPTTGCIEVIKQ